MSMEPTLVYAAIARLADEKVNLAAFSSVVFPVSLVVEGPIIMLLAASTRLATSWERYRKVMTYGHIMCAVLTVLHAAVAFTPLYGVVADQWIGSDPEVSKAARIGLMIMLPWTYAIGYRRAQQGVLIRYERSGAVTQGTMVRLVVVASVLTTLSLLKMPGIIVAACGVSAGVTAEAIFAGFKAREVYPGLRAAKDDEPLDLPRFARFYAPLALTPLITLIIQPIGAASMNRMPRNLDSVATWGPVHALVFSARSVGMAFNEVVVTLVAFKGGARALKRFGLGLAAITSALLALVYFTPLAELWFGKVQSIPANLVPLARLGVGMCILMPAYQVAQSWFQGLLVHAQTTRAITEAVIVYFLVCGFLVILGADGSDFGWLNELCRIAPVFEHLRAPQAELFGVEGIAWTLCSFVTAGLSQTAWLWWRSRSVPPTP